MNGSSIQPERAWHMALDQLRMDMPKSAFDSWVRDTSFVSFEDGVFSVGTPNVVWPRVACQPAYQHCNAPADWNSGPAGGSSIRCYGR